MPKYLFLSDSPFIPTGFRNQSLLLAEHLVNDGNEVSWIAPSHVGCSIKNAVLPDGRKCNFTVMPGGRHPHAVDVLPQRIAEVRPDVFYCLLDSFMLMDRPNGMPNIFDMNLPMPSTHWTPMKSALWFPSDGGYFPGQGTPVDCFQVLKKFDMPVAMSKWGRDQIKTQYNTEVKYIPHGIRSKDFYAVSPEDKRALRQKYQQNVGKNFQNHFVVGCVARNQPRKFMDRLVKTYASFAKGKDDVLLLLHSDPRDPAQPFPIDVLLQRAGIMHKTSWTGMNAMTGWPDSQMNDVYNLFDVKLDTTSGEGFGLTIIEGMSAEVPIICTDYTTTRELILDHNAGLGIKLAGEQNDLYDGKAESGVAGTITGGWGVERGVSDIQDGVKKLQQCYDDWKLGGTQLQEMGRNGRKAVLAEYDFSTCVWPAWKKTFARMLS